MVCNYCGASNENDAAFCMNCGGSLSPSRSVRFHLDHLCFKKGFSFHIIPFLRALLDVSCHPFVSVKIIKMIYALSIFSAGLVAMISIIAGFYGSLFLGMFVLLIGAPLIFVLMVLYSRIFLEMVLVNSQRADPKIKKEEQPESVDHIEWNVKADFIDDRRQATEIQFRSPVMEK